MSISCSQVIPGEEEKFISVPFDLAQDMLCVLGVMPIPISIF